MLRISNIAHRYNFRLSLFFIVFVSIMIIGSSSSFASETTPDELSPQTPRVVLVSLPRVTWKILRDSQTPNIDSLINRGSIASLSIRTPQKTRTIEKGYASLASGNRALAVPSESSTFYAPQELVESQFAGEIYQEQQGAKPGNVAAVSVGFELVRSLNNNGLFPADVGSFAAALESKGKSVSVFGNSDTCAQPKRSCHQRAIGYMGVNQNGVVRFGDVSQDLLNSDLSVDMNVLKRKTIDSLIRHNVTAVECSDLEKIEQVRKSTTASISKTNFDNAMAQCDKLIGSIVSKLDFSRDRIFIVSPISPQAQEQMTIFIAAGKGIRPGYAISGITRREGIVALADIAPSILTFLGVEPPDSMVTTLLDFKPSSQSLASRQNSVIQTNDRALIRDSSFVMVSALFILTVFLGVILSIVAHTKYPRMRGSAKMFSLMSACMPTLTFLMLPIMLTLGSPQKVAAGFFALAMISAGVVYFFGEKFGYVKAMLGLVSINLGVQIIDIITNGHLQLNSLFGYSAIVAGRFAGYGNLTFSIIAISAVCFVALIQELSVSHPQWNMKWVNRCLIIFLVCILVLDGAPTFGSDVGGVLAIAPTIYVIYLMLAKRRFNVKSFAISVISAVVAISIFSLFDLTRPISERTHLGRFVKIFLNGQAGVVIERKILSNFHILTNSLFASVLILGTIFGLFLFMRPEKFLSETTKAHPSFRFIAYPGLIVGVLGMFLNDSGVAIPGMMIAIAFPIISLLTFENPQRNESDPTLVEESV